MQRIAGRVDVVDAVGALPVDHEQHMRNLKRRAGVVDAGQLLEFGLRADLTQIRRTTTLRAFLRLRRAFVRAQGAGVLVGRRLAGGLRQGVGATAHGKQQAERAQNDRANTQVARRANTA
ncbi:hypothetical protein D3C87_1524320 [compost metagenome]